jgi:hypothetical protein
LGIRIPDPDPGARKLRNFSRKMHFLVFKKKLPLKRYKIALTTFWKKIDEKHWYFLFDLTQILISKKFEKKNCLRKFCFSLDPDPELDPD